MVQTALYCHSDAKVGDRTESLKQSQEPLPLMTTDALSRDGALTFEDFRLDRSEGLSRLRESGRCEPVMLGSRALAMLSLLVQHGGEVVTRRALMEAVWPGVAVEDSNLTVQMSALRRTLDEDRAGGSCIQTVVGRGYRFRPAVTREAVPHLGRVTDAPRSAIPQGPTVAALPFANFSLDPRWDRFCDGLVEDIITCLARYSDLLVIARQSSFAYRGRSMDIRDIGRELGARYILEGSVQAGDGRLKVTAQLINAATGVHVWADRYSRDEADLFAVQEEIVDRIIAAVAGFDGSLLRAETTAARRKPPASLQAHEMYLLAYEQEARLDREGTARSIELLEAALALDPYYARAWIVLGWALGNAAQSGWTGDVVATRTRQRDAVLKAVEMDPGDSLALLGLAALYRRENDHAGARHAAERALVAGAHHADSLAFLASHASAILDRPEEAIVLMERSFTLNPHVPAWYYLHHVRAAYFARRFEFVPEYFERLMSDPATSMTPLRPQKLFRALAFAQLGREADTAIAVKELRVSDPDLRVIKAEMAGLCPAAYDLFRNGLRMACLAD